jgi:hypothetical protein
MQQYVLAQAVCHDREHSIMTAYVAPNRELQADRLTTPALTLSPKFVRESVQFSLTNLCELGGGGVKIDTYFF